MGFRDIHAFNLAMLAKQAWQLIQGSLSLLFKVYKARYFPACSFIEAVLGSNPSYIWRSLLEARELIKAATVWKVGDGRSIKLEDNRWLPHPPKLQPNANMNLRVIVGVCTYVFMFLFYLVGRHAAACIGPRAPLMYSGGWSCNTYTNSLNKILSLRSKKVMFCWAYQQY